MRIFSEQDLIDKKIQHDHYCKKILATISAIENQFGHMFQNIYPDLEQEFWNLADQGRATATLRKLRQFSFKLDKILRDLRGQQNEVN